MPRGTRYKILFRWECYELLQRENNPNWLEIRENTGAGWIVIYQGVSHGNS